jgi:hypothetical protein
MTRGERTTFPLSYASDTATRRKVLRVTLIAAGATCVSSVGIVLAWWLRLKPPSGQVVNDTFDCSTRLRHLGTRLRAYAQDHGGQFPTTLEALLEEGYVKSNDLHCPRLRSTASNGAVVTPGYIYIGSGVLLSDPPETPLIFEPASNHNAQVANVLRVDGWVDIMDKTWSPTTRRKRSSR